MCLTNHSLFLIVSFVRCTRLICVQGVVHKTHAEQKIGFKGSQWVVYVPTHDVAGDAGGFCKFEKLQPSFEVTGGGVGVSFSTAFESKSTDSRLQSNAMQITNIPVNDSKQPPNAQYNSS